MLATGGLVAALATDSSPELGLDLQGGLSVVLEPTTSVEDGELDQAVAIIRNRVDGLGVAEPEISRQGDAVIVQLPGVDDRNRVLDLVGSTAELRFRPVLAAMPIEQAEQGPPADGAEAGETDAPAGSDTGEETDGDAGGSEEPAGSGDEGSGDENAAGEPLPVELVSAQDDSEAPEQDGGTPPEQDGDNEQEAPSTRDPSQLTPPEEDEADATVTLDGIDDNRYILGPTLATGQIVETAKATLTEVGQWVVSLRFRSGSEGIDKFNEAASVCFGGTNPQCPTGALAIVLDSQVQSAPQINQPSYDREGAVIEGENIDEREAKDLALALRYGALPVELERQSVETVSATLGEDSLRAGVLAGSLGVLLVALYMIVYYRVLGVAAMAGMTVWGALMYAVISWLGVTQGLALTLAGVTGIIISVGVTVDSYVVYFERYKDEVKMGRTLRTSAERAFKGAFRTILAANTATFIGAAVLYQFTVGPVRGFAFFLGLSTVLGVLVTWMYTRTAVVLMARNRRFRESPVLGIAGAMPRPDDVATRTAPAGSAS